MKFSQVSLLAAAVATVNGAAVTVTQHVHQESVVSVQGVVYVENGQTHTTYSVIGGATNSAEAPVSTTLLASTSASTSLDPTSAVQTTSPTKDTTTLTPTTSSSSSTKQTKSSTSSSTSAQQSSTSTASSGFASTILKAHNDKRALHKDTSSLTWSDELASYAQAYADKYDCSGTLTHSGGKYGENLAAGYDAAGSVNAWYDEIKDYDYSNPSYSSATGHFTQVVWKGSTQLGCGIKNCNNAWGNYVICSYSPAGNVIGKFPDNVQPLN